ncbi:hypothetical protein [Lentzea sp. NPDC059081]|uniref:hypothetical protein n=1 Tax=Lentzea sp. NPDC059081 TaxID=3346719 RepID=UPI003679CB47
MRRVLLFLVVMIAVGVPVVLPAQAVARDQDAISEIAGCVRERGKLAVLMLMDESTSLRENDRDDNRVTAAMVAVSRLKASLAVPDSRPVSVRMRLDGFSFDVKPGIWRDLATEETAIEADVAGFAQRDGIDGTDYVKALSSANETLLQQVEDSRARDEDPPCQLLLWFTDGVFMPRAVSPSAEDMSELCGADGVVTRLRTTGATMLTVGLKGEGPPDENLLRSITGLSDGCGVNASRDLGYYLSASDGPGLIDAFARIVYGPVSDCGSDCRFVLEPPMRNAYVLIHTDGSGQPLRLVPPRGQDGLSLLYQGNAAEIAGVSVRWEWISKNLVVLNGDLAPGDAARWKGEWRVEGSSLRSGRVFLTSNLEQRLAEEPVFLQGEPWRVRTEVLAGGRAFAPENLAPLHPEIVVSISDGEDTVSRTVQPDTARSSVAEVAFDAPAWRASEVTVKVELRVRTPSGIEINPSPLVRKVPVRTPLSVTPKSLSLPKRQGREPIRGVITVAAGTTPGCAWIDDARTTVRPAQVKLMADAKADASDRCVRVDAGKRVEVPFELGVSRGCRCLVRGVLPVVLEVDGKPVPVGVPFEFVSEANALDQIVAMLVLLLLTLVPLGLMLFANWFWVARFAHPRLLTVLCLDVEVTPEGVQWDDRWWERGEYYPPSRPPRRRLTAQSVEFRTRTPLNPFRPPLARAVTTHGRVLATPDSTSPGRMVDGLPLNLTDQVVVVADEERAYQRFTADVVIVLDAGWLDPERVARLRDLAGRAATRLRPPRRGQDQDHRPD